MAKAFVLVETAMGRAKEVDAGFRHIEGVKSVDTVTGPYDVIAVVEAETLNELGDFVTEKIHTVAGISRTVTCLSV